MWQKLSHREQILLIVLAAVGFIYVFWTYIFQPQLQALGEMRRELKTANARLEQGRDIVSSFRRAELAVQEAETRFSKVAPWFNNDVQDGTILVDIGLEAAKRGVAVTLVRPGESVKAEHYCELPFEFTVRGDYGQVLEFIDKVENLANASEIRRMEIKALTLTENASVSPSSADGRVQANFTLVLYAAPTPENKLQLDALAEWAVGRSNAYQARGTTIPYPGIK
ncbi:MAG: type 4a pilus biogenesis protein PilO [Bacillota bacterium]